MIQEIHQLDPRLDAALQLFPYCRTAADIGTDHGLLPLHLLKRGICSRIIATDKSIQALNKAKKLIARYQLEGQVDFICGDGLKPLAERDVEAVSICGMGGKTISRILTQGLDLVHHAEMIISAQTQIPEVRETLYSKDYHIVKERIIQAKGKYYFMIHAVYGAGTATDPEIQWGKALLDQPDETAKRYIAWQADNISKIAPEHIDASKRFLLEKAFLIQNSNSLQEEQYGTT